MSYYKDPADYSYSEYDNDDVDVNTPIAGDPVVNNWSQLVNDNSFRITAAQIMAERQRQVREEEEIRRTLAANPIVPVANRAEMLRPGIERVIEAFLKKNPDNHFFNHITEYIKSGILYHRRDDKDNEVIYENRKNKKKEEEETKGSVAFASSSSLPENMFKLTRSKSGFFSLDDLNKAPKMESSTSSALTISTPAASSSSSSSDSHKPVRTLTFLESVVYKGSISSVHEYFEGLTKKSNKSFIELSTEFQRYLESKNVPGTEQQTIMSEFMRKRYSTIIKDIYRTVESMFPIDDYGTNPKYKDRYESQQYKHEARVIVSPYINTMKTISPDSFRKPYIFTIGRARSCDILVKDPTWPRFHCMVVVDPIRTKCYLFGMNVTNLANVDKHGKVIEVFTTLHRLNANMRLMEPESLIQVGEISRDDKRTVLAFSLRHTHVIRFSGTPQHEVIIEGFTCKKCNQDRVDRPESCGHRLLCNNCTLEIAERVKETKVNEIVECFICNNKSTIKEEAFYIADNFGTEQGLAIRRRRMASLSRSVNLHDRHGTVRNRFDAKVTLPLKLGKTNKFVIKKKKADGENGS